MDKSLEILSILLLILACLTVTQGQYYDVLQGFQQFFQPYQQQNGFFSQFNDVPRQTTQHRQTNRQENKKKTETQDKFINNPPIHQYDYVFSTTTTPKPSRKPPKSNSSQANKSSNRNFNAGFNLNFNDYFPSNIISTTKRNRVNSNNKKTTTVRPHNKATTSNFGSISFYDRGFNNPATENPFENNNRDIYSVSNYETSGNSHENNQNNRRPDNSGSSVDYSRVTSNNRKPHLQNVNTNQNRGNNNNFGTPTNNRNPDVNGINNRPVTQNNRPKYGQTTSGFVTDNNRQNIHFDHINRGNNDMVKPNNFGNHNRQFLNTDFDGDSGVIFPGNPLINRPGVRPVPVDANQPPITNKPITEKNNFVPFERPSNPGYENTENPDSPEILIGPDEDDMTEAQKRRYINTAERMCDRYKNLNVKELVALPLLPSPDPVEFNVSSCPPITIPLVIGGKIASINEFPHMALVGWKKIREAGYSWKCGGSLISNRYVLTAGHCTYQEKDYDVDSGPPQAVQLGSSYLDDPRATIIKISAVIRHPKYKQRRSYYDIALIKLAKTVTFTEVIRPACLGVAPSVGRNIIATGWGRTEFGGDYSRELRTVSLPIWNIAECKEIWGTSLKLPSGPSPDSHVCAGEKQGGKDTCQGDSGGPAQIQDGCVWRVVAVTSYGRSCGAPNTPALYAVVKRAFIAAQVFGEDEDYSGRNQNSRNYDQPSFYNRPQTFGESSYFVNNFRRQ